jgi:hypothetical protein
MHDLWDRDAVPIICGIKIMNKKTKTTLPENKKKTAIFDSLYCLYFN